MGSRRAVGSVYSAGREWFDSRLPLVLRPSLWGAIARLVLANKLRVTAQEPYL